MSGFTVVFECSFKPVEPGVFERVMDRLSHRGPDGCDVWIAGHVAMGHWHFWTTPQEIGERQPLALAGLPFRVVLDGRLDNRQELLDALQLKYSQDASLSDAALVLRAYDRWGRDCFQHFIGEYALVIFDEQRQELICGRDALGDRSLFYSSKGTRIVLASEQWAVAGADGDAEELNDSAIAHFFALKAYPAGETIYKNVFELPSAHGMGIKSSGITFWRHWQPDLSRRLVGKTDQEYSEGFLHALEESVRCRLRSNSPAAVLMSGGLDSTSVASLAARQIAPAQLTTLSYVFDELPSCDERSYIETMKTRWNIHSIQVPCDDLWPYKNLPAWPRNPNRPDGNCYRMVLERIYQRAEQAGLCVLLTGHCGDDLYLADDNWLADLISEGRLREATEELKLLVRYTGAYQTLKSAYLRRAVLSMLQAFPGGKALLDPLVKRWWIRRRSSDRPWLTSYAAKELLQDKSESDPVRELRTRMINPLDAEGNSSETYHTGRHRLEFRYPYRDRRLVEYVLSLPAHQLYRHGMYKYILRMAMQGILPEAIRMRGTTTTLLALFSRGVERDKMTILEYINKEDAAWRRYVCSDWLMEHWKIPVTPENDGAQAVVPWLCVSYSSWYQVFVRNGGNNVTKNILG